MSSGNPSPSSLALAVLLLASVITSCKGPPDHEPNIVSFTATPSHLPTGGGEVELKWRVENAEQVRVADVTGLPLEGSLRVHVEEDEAFLLVASNRGSGARAEVHVTVERLDASGVVLDETGTPIPGIEVSVNGLDPVLTDESGRYSVAAVYAPYSIRVSDPAVPRRDQAYVGLTEPVTQVVLGPLALQPAPLFHTFSLRGAWSSGIDAGLDAVTAVIVFGDDGTGADFWLGTPTDKFAGQFQLPGATLQNVDVLVLQYRLGDTADTWWYEFERFAWLPNVTITEGEWAELGELVMTPIQNRVVTFNPTPATWITEVGATPLMRVPGRAAHALGPKVEPSTVTLEVPDLPIDISFEVESWARGQRILEWDNGPSSFSPAVQVPDDDVLNLAFLDPAVLSLAHEATLGPDGDLSWISAAPVCRVELDTFNYGTAVALWTDRKHLTRRDLQRAGVQLLPSTEYQWQVTCFEGLDSLGSALGDPARFVEIRDTHSATNRARSATHTFHP